MLQCDHYMPLDPYNQIVKGHLRETGFYHIFHIGVVQCQLTLVNALIERWCPETHTFHFLVGECAVTLEDVAIILGISTNGLPVTGPTLSSYEALEAECLYQFGVTPRKTDCRGSFIKLTWLQGLKDRVVLADDIHIQRYVKSHIMLLFGTVMFGDKSGTAVHWKFLSWGSACLTHLYRALCRATRINCKEIDGPLTLLLTWAWIRLPFFAPILGNPRLFPIANRWRNWERADRPYRFRSLAHFRRALDDLQEGQVIHESNQIVDDEADDYLVDHLNEDGDEDEDEDKDEDEDEDEDADDADDDDDDCPYDGLAPSGGTTTSEKGKGYNLRVDPPRQSANRYTSSAFNRVAKKCKKLYKDEKWTMRK
ncbi:hypothetical protein Ahy_B05g074533 [Arachis hypogaea]|uniref:Aminotransferase-like plant mobile domain-containing protein n=1 Tax=Arachis hypogaea TaxID=3818 RepID=A0A444YZ60_ARAHY|nr:hypothetical protein Ahy_B05g074533 [Arachis hypogaea]